MGTKVGTKLGTKELCHTLYIVSNTLLHLYTVVDNVWTMFLWVVWVRLGLLNARVFEICGQFTHLYLTVWCNSMVRYANKGNITRMY